MTYTRGILIQVMFWMLFGNFFFQILEALPRAIIPLQLRWEGASDALIGFLSTSLSSIISLFWSPVVGTQSDRHRSRLGRRRPFLLWCTPPVVLSFVLLGMAEKGGLSLRHALSMLGVQHLSIAACTIAWIGLCIVIFLFFNAYITQVFSCLVADVIPQQVMGKFAGIYGTVGCLGGIVFNRWVLGLVKAHTAQIYALTGMLYTVVLYVVIWRVKEGEYPPPSPKPPSGRIGMVKGYFKECFSHWFYINIYIITFCYWCSLAPLSFTVFFATVTGNVGYAPTLALTLQEFGVVTGWTFLVQIPIFIVVGLLSDRLHPLRMAMTGLLLTSVSYFCCFSFINSSTTLLLWLSVNQGALAVFQGASLALFPRLFPREKYGQFVSANVVCGTISLIFAPPLVGLLFQEIRDYRYLFVFSGLSTMLAFFASITLFFQWKRLGGDTQFVPPDPTTRAPIPAA